MKYHFYFFQKLGKMSQNLSSAAVVIGALRVKCDTIFFFSEQSANYPGNEVCFSKNESKFAPFLLHLYVSALMHQ